MRLTTAKGAPVDGLVTSNVVPVGTVSPAMVMEWAVSVSSSAILAHNYSASSEPAAAGRRVV